MPRDTDEEWLEHQSASGRKFYENTATREIQWKPPRKFVRNNRYSYSSENNIGVVLKKGDLLIANIYGGRKKKYAQAVGYLTNSHFLYTKRKRPNDYFRKIPLFEADIQRDGNAYVLHNVFHTIRFKSKTHEIAEIWYHDIWNVIHNLSGGKLATDSLPYKDLNSKDFNQNFQPTIMRERALSVIEENLEEIPHKYPTPPGWIAKFDAFKGEYVYVNQKNYSEVWSVVNVGDGRIYFNNSETNEKSWLLPWQQKETIV